MSPTMKRYTLTEQVTGGQPRVDREGKIIRNVKILGAESKNRRTYTEQAMDKAATLYEGMTVSFDHDRERPDRERGFMEGGGVLRNVGRRDGGVYGDLHYFEAHPNTPLVLERAERFPESFGLSHNARGSATPGEAGQLIVEDIEAVMSVDIVSNPATNRGLFESEELASQTEEPTVSQKKLTLLEAARQRYPDTARRVLLEMEDMGVDPMMEMPAGQEDPVEAVKQSLADEAKKVFLDDSIDAKETGKKVGELAKAVEDVKKKLKGDVLPTAGSGEGSEASASEGGDEAAMESHKRQASQGSTALLESVQRLERRELARDLCESYDTTLNRLSPAVRKQLLACSDESEMTDLLESLSPAQLGKRKPAIRGLHTTEQLHESVPTDIHGDPEKLAKFLA